MDIFFDQSFTNNNFLSSVSCLTNMHLYLERRTNMRRSTFPYSVKKFCLGLLMVMCITSIMVFPVSASAEAATVDLENGE